MAGVGTGFVGLAAAGADFVALMTVVPAEGVVPLGVVPVDEASADVVVVVPVTGGSVRVLPTGLVVAGWVEGLAAGDAGGVDWLGGGLGFDGGFFVDGEAGWGSRLTACAGGGGGGSWRGGAESFDGVLAVEGAGGLGCRRCCWGSALLSGQARAPGVSSCGAPGVSSCGASCASCAIRPGSSHQNHSSEAGSADRPTRGRWSGLNVSRRHLRMWALATVDNAGMSSVGQNGKGGTSCNRNGGATPVRSFQRCAKTA